MVSPADSTLAMIRTKVRRLTSSPSESALSNSTIDTYINNFYTQDFAYAIKIDQSRVVYEFFTEPDIDVYPLDINKYQSLRAPIYFEGVQGQFFKDRSQFFNMWPRYPTQLEPETGDGVTLAFTFTVDNVPFLRNNVVLGTVDKFGTTLRVSDDGEGVLNLEVPNSLGNYTQTNIGSVDYVTGDFSIKFLTAPANGVPITLWISQYQNGRPYCLLFWNNELTVRPVPDNVYKIEIEAYQTPAQFIATTQDPTLNQWWNYIAIGASLHILEDRQDMDGYQNLLPIFQKQEALVLERQANEEIGQANTTIYNTVVQPAYGYPQGWY